MTAKKNTKKTTTKKKTHKPTATMRVSQSAIANRAIHNIELLYKKMGLSPISTVADKQRLMGTASVPTMLIEEVASTVDNHGTLVGMHFDSEKAREALAYAAAFEPVATKAHAFSQRVRDAIVAAKGDAGASALAVYASMKGVIRRPEGAALRDSFIKMTAIMKTRRKVGAAKAAAAVAKAASKVSASSATTTPPAPITSAMIPAPAARTPAPATTNGAAAKTTNGTTVVITPPEAHASA